MKRICAVLLSFLLTLGSIGTLVSCKKQVEDDSSQPISSLPDSEYSSTEDDFPEKVERLGVQARLVTNLNTVSLADAVLAADKLADNPLILIQSVASGITVGDLLKDVAGDILSFDYYDDGYWYLASGVKFTVVLNAIFSYEILSDEPLNLTQNQLERWGDRSIIECFGDMFAIKIETVISQALGVSADYIAPLLAMTVRDLYNMTCGDYTFIINVFTDYPIATLARMVGDVIIASAPENEQDDYSEKAALVVKYITDNVGGTLSAIECAEDYTVSQFFTGLGQILVVVYPASADIINQSVNQISQLYKDVLMKDLFKATFASEGNKVLEAVSTLLKLCIPQSEQTAIQSFIEILSKAFSVDENGTLIVNSEKTVAEFVNEIAAALQKNYPTNTELIVYVLTQIAQLYGEGKLASFVQATKNINKTQFKNAVINIAKTVGAAQEVLDKIALFIDQAFEQTLGEQNPEMVDMTLAEIDSMYFNGAVFANAALADIASLKNYSLKQFASILTDARDQSLMGELGNISLLKFINAVYAYIGSFGQVAN